MLKALIVEDETQSCALLKNMLTNFCTDVHVLACTKSVEEAVVSLKKEVPDVVFLDIELPGGNGFTLFEHFPQPEFSVIFTTAHDQYAVRALRLSAVDYLHKPIDLEELLAALSKVQHGKKTKEEQQKILNLKHKTFVGFVFISWWW